MDKAVYGLSIKNNNEILYFYYSPNGNTAGSTTWIFVYGKTAQNILG